MPAWHEPGTREVGARILAEERTLHEGMTDPHGDAFNRALDVALTPGNGRLVEAATMRGRGARGQSAVDPEVAEFQVELGQRGTNLRSVRAAAHAKQKAKARGGAGRTDEFEPPEEEVEREPFTLYPPDDFEPEEDFGADAADPYADLPEHIARHLRDDEDEPGAPPAFTIPAPAAGDAYSPFEFAPGRLGRDELGQLLVAVESDPSLAPARRFELSQTFGRAYGAQV